MIDHINGSRADNRIANLRPSDHRHNAENLKQATAQNSCKLIGAHWHKLTKQWRANIRVQGKQKSLGKFPTAIDAHLAYVKAKRELHAGCTI
jgi:(p)ppGpp synthase/HD superfamily hydrolase